MISVSSLDLIINKAKLTLLRVSLAHTLAAAASTLNSSHYAIHIRGTTPLLVSENVDTKVLLARLDKANIRQHSLVLEST
jgi:hypothetical protein